MTQQPGLPLVSRRHLVQSIGAAATASVAGCLGENGGSDPEGSDTPDDIEEESTPESTEAEGDGQDYSLPESAHRTPGQMASDWGTAFRHETPEWVDAYSPSQVADVQGETWMRQHGGEEYYSMFGFDPEHVPETIIQYAEDHSVKVDQLPGGVKHEDIKSSPEDAGYEEVGTVGDFEVLVSQEENNVRAVGDGYHVLTINEVHNGNDLERKRMDVEAALEAYKSDESHLQSDMQDMRENLDIEDTFVSEIKRDGEYIDGINDPDLEPLGGAVTINLAEGIKRGIWKFESEGEAGTVHATTESEDINGSGFDDLEQKGRYIVAEGTYQGKNAAYFSPYPDI